MKQKQLIGTIGQRSAVETGQMPAVETGQVPVLLRQGRDVCCCAEPGQMSAVETGRISAVETFTTKDNQRHLPNDDLKTCR